MKIQLENGCIMGMVRLVQLAKLIKLTTSKVLFKDFFCLLRTAILRNNSFVLTGQDHIHSMRDFHSNPICSQFSYTFVVLERSLEEICCSKAFDKTGKVINHALT